MTTSSSDPLPTLRGADQSAQAAELMAGAGSLPDIAALQHMANEFFRAAPQAPLPQAGGGAMPAAPAAVSDIPAQPIADPFGLTAAPQFALPRVPSLPLADFTRPPNVDTLAGYYFMPSGAPVAPAKQANPAPQADAPILNSRFEMPPVQDLTLDDFTRPPKGMGDNALYFMDEVFRLGGASESTRKQAGKGGHELREAVKQARQDAMPAEPRPATPKLDAPPVPFDVGAVRRDFPVLNERVHGMRLVWLDNGATSQKPQSVIDRISSFYERENSNIHRAAHTLAARATDAYEAAREKTRRFLGARSTKEIVFVRGATEAINLVAKSWGVQHVGKGDEVVITHLEHHANIVPWQMLCNATGAKLKIAPVDDRGDVLLSAYEQLMGPRVKLVALTQVSNALGTVTPVAEMVEIAHRFGARVLVDGAQAVQHMRIDVSALDCDWYVFSGHKVFAPTGIGVLYGKQDVLEASPPWQGGGNMISDVTFDRTLYQPAPGRFEAGTGSIADAVGLGAAIDYVERVGIENISRHEHELMDYLLRGLRALPVRLIGEPRERAGVVSFVSPALRPEDIGAALDQEGIAVRAGHHCAQPILRRFGVETSVRPSLALYNTREDIDALIDALRRILNVRK